MGPGGPSLCGSVPVWGRGNVRVQLLLWPFQCGPCKSLWSLGSGIFTVVSYLWVIPNLSSCEGDWSQEWAMSPPWWCPGETFLWQRYLTGKHKLRGKYTYLSPIQRCWIQESQMNTKLFADVAGGLIKWNYAMATLLALTFIEVGQTSK